jgi:DNA-binding NtrC family response regulator
MKRSDSQTAGMNRRHRVLVVDDDQTVRQYLSHYLSLRGYAVDCLDSGETVVSWVKSPNRPSVVLLDLLMPKTCGLEVLAQMLKLDWPVPAIVLSAVTQVSTVVQAMRLGAADYLVKPLEEEKLEEAIQNVLAKKSPAVKTIPVSSAENSNYPFDIASSVRKMKEITELALRIADTDVPVLILGESGAGKEVIARFIHARSMRRNEPFVKVNCAALPADLLESEFFGYDAGAFTGAMRDKPGKFELAGHGTIVLDEIAEMSPHLQAKLLHVLQDGEYIRVGGVRPLRSHARILALTNRNLVQAVANGEFRQDLYFRLNVIRIEIPPLRERREDIPALCDYFIQKYSDQYGRARPSLPQHWLDAFCKFPWPGNIRQLENVIKRFVILPDTDLLASDLAQPLVSAGAAPQTSSSSLRDLSSKAAEEAEKEVVFRTLQEVNWNRKLAARKLNVCYKSLLNKLRRWDVDLQRSQSELRQ